MSVPPWPRPDISLRKTGTMGRARAVLRMAILGCVLAVLLPLMMLTRLIERMLGGQTRPISPYVTQVFFRACLGVMNIRVEIAGAPMDLPGAVVGNHASWLDILVLNARHRVFFVSKSEVAGWPVIGFLARLSGTLFIRRDAREARAQTAALETRLAAGQTLLFFPEGTSTDGLRVLPFKATLFQAFFAPALGRAVHIQPVSVIYEAPEGADPAFYGWFGAMEFAPHFAAVLAARRRGTARLVYHAPLRVADYADRKTLAKDAETAVRSAMPPGHS